MQPSCREQRSWNNKGTHRIVPGHKKHHEQKEHHTITRTRGGWDKDGGPLGEEPEYIRLPPEVRILEHAHVPGTPSFTIRGVIENAGATEWTGTSIEAVIKAGGAQMNRCDPQIDGKFPPKSRRAFQIECYGVSGSDVPDNISYELSVRYARKRPG